MPLSQLPVLHAWGWEQEWHTVLNVDMGTYLCRGNSHRSSFFLRPFGAFRSLWNWNLALWVLWLCHWPTLWAAEGNIVRFIYWFWLSNLRNIGFDFSHVPRSKWSQWEQQWCLKTVLWVFESRHTEFEALKFSEIFCPLHFCILHFSILSSVIKTNQTLKGE